MNGADILCAECLRRLFDPDPALPQLYLRRWNGNKAVDVPVQQRVSWIWSEIVDGANLLLDYVGMFSGSLLSVTFAHGEARCELHLGEASR